jgi:hypothetical protein
MSNKVTSTMKLENEYWSDSAPKKKSHFYLHQVNFYQNYNSLPILSQLDFSRTLPPKVDTNSLRKSNQMALYFDLTFTWQQSSSNHVTWLQIEEELDMWLLRCDSINSNETKKSCVCMCQLNNWCSTLSSKWILKSICR